MTEDSQIETNIRNDGKLLRYSSNNLKKSLDLAKKISDRNLSLDTDSYNYSILPNVIEQCGRGERAFDVYSRLLRYRIISLYDKIDSNLANKIVEQLQFLESEDSEKDIYLYINSPSGSVLEGMSIFDTMNQIRPDVCTVCTGFAGGMGAFLLSAGARGKRISISSSRIMIRKPSGSEQGQLTDKEIVSRARENLYIKNLLTNLLANNTGHPPEKIDKDTDRDFYMSAVEAKEYGLIDIVYDHHFSIANPPLDLFK